MWHSRTKRDLIIEVWEKLDCESVGAAEIEAIEVVVLEQYGKGAVGGPMITARLLADEGAVLRHSEILELDARRKSTSPYDAMFRNIFKCSTFREVSASIGRLENLRRKFLSDSDQEGIRLISETVIEEKERAMLISRDARFDESDRLFNSEIAEWFAIWLQSPEIFGQWVEIRKRSAEFIDKFESKETEK